MCAAIRSKDAALVNSDDLRVEHVLLVVDQDADAGRHLLVGGVVVEDGLVADDGGILPHHSGRNFEFSLLYMN